MKGEEAGDLLGMAQDLLTISAKITEWEIKFVKDIIHRLKNGTKLSEKQKRYLVDIYIIHARKGNIAPAGAERNHHGSV